MSQNDKSRAATANYGIQATQVSADVLAVGENAKASKTSLDLAMQHELHGVVIQLQEALRLLTLRSEDKTAIDKDLDALRAETSKNNLHAERVASIAQNLS